MTDWKTICEHLDNSYQIDELVDMLKQILPDINTDFLNKRQLCELISNDFEDYRQKHHLPRSCSNTGIIESDYNDLPDSHVVSFEQNNQLYCFTLEEFAGILSTTRRNPYNRLPLPDNAIKQYNRKMMKQRLPEDKLRSRQRLQERL